MKARIEAERPRSRSRSKGRSRLDIVVDIFNSEALSGWVRGSEGPRTVLLTLDGQDRALRADRARPDLAAATAFRHEFDASDRDKLLRGEALGVALENESCARLEMRLPIVAKPATAKPIAFVIPAGQVDGRDDVSWYNPDDIAKNLFNYHNIGDSFVYDSSLKVLNHSSAPILKISEVDERNIAHVNEHCCAVVLRGSNYFHASMDWMEAEEVFRRIKVPIICFGVGIQKPDGRALAMTGAQVRMLHLLADRCESVGVRGARTAEELAAFGVKNLDVIGCPTLFRRRTRQGGIASWTPEAVRRVAFNTRREVSPDYARNAASYLRRHLDIFALFDGKFETTVMTHGEVAEKIFAFKQEQHYAAASAELAQHGWFGKAPEDRVRAAYLSRIFYSDRVRDYDSFVQSFDLVTGYRLHGNLIALANGVPSFYFVYDERTLEICETFDIPFFDVRGAKPFELDEVMRPDLFAGFNAKFPVAYDTMVAFLERNGLPHRM